MKTIIRNYKNDHTIILKFGLKISTIDLYFDSHIIEKRLIYIILNSISFSILCLFQINSFPKDKETQNHSFFYINLLNINEKKDHHM